MQCGYHKNGITDMYNYVFKQRNTLRLLLRRSILQRPLAHRAHLSHCKASKSQVYDTASRNLKVLPCNYDVH